MKLKFARTMLAVAILLFFSGFMILCNCPGWFVISAVFAALAVWKAFGKVRVFACIVLGAALVMTALDALAEYKLTRRINVLKQTHQPIGAANTGSTTDPNSSAPSKN
jgi:hypothetical protein